MVGRFMGGQKISDKYSSKVGKEGRVVGRKVNGWKMSWWLEDK